jgi:hypothetical protein
MVKKLVKNLGNWSKLWKLVKNLETCQKFGNWSRVRELIKSQEIGHQHSGQTGRNSGRESINEEMEAQFWSSEHV